MTQDADQRDFSSIYSRDSHVDLSHNSGNKAKPRKLDDPQIKLFNNLLSSVHSEESSLVSKNIQKYWTQNVFNDSVIFFHNDKILWGPFIICIHKDILTEQFTCLILDNFGISTVASLDISKKSQFYPAIENLNAKNQKSNTKRCIAVAMLQRFSLLTKVQLERIDALYPTRKTLDYDQVNAGQIASACKPVTSISSHTFGKRLINGGFLSNRLVKSTLIDVVYQSDESTIELNNRLVFHLGEQLEQLFNPVTEYSPEQTEYGYKPPEDDIPTETDNTLIKAICNELLEIQSNFTFSLVEFLQKFLIPLRVQVLNNEIEGLSTVKLNRLFPPTIDEVTRINCIFLDSLKSAISFGSFEVLKACNMTIAYFYKAYTRHEAASKNFSKDIKLFLKNFGDIMPCADIYTEMKLETIIKGPQEKLLKLKLIMERLYRKKEWSEINIKDASKYYSNIIDIIDSFGHLETPMSSYNARVFTPSGKILTELAKGWPVELQYKWLKRRIVGVFDVIDTNFTSKRNLLVIFSDYIMFLNIIDFQKYYNSNESSNKPLISDILMNSLINELPLPPKIPKLQVEQYCNISHIQASVIGDDKIRFDAVNENDENPFSVTCQLTSQTNKIHEIADLITKAKILEKDTAFHLFKSVTDETILYSTAHELEAYNNERIKSKFALFLNIEPSDYHIILNKLHLAIFAKVSDIQNTYTVELTILKKRNLDEITKITIGADEIIPAVLSVLSSEFPICYSSIYSGMATALVSVNNAASLKIMQADNKAKVISENSTPNISQEINDETKKSYGTITTFRSDVSDLKDITNSKSSAPSKKSSKFKKTTNDDTVSSNKMSLDKRKVPKIVEQLSAKKAKKTKDNLIENKSTLQGGNKTAEKGKRNRGFLGILKGIFGNNGKSIKSKPINKPSVSKEKHVRNKPDKPKVKENDSRKEVPTENIQSPLDKENKHKVILKKEKSIVDDVTENTEIDKKHTTVPNKTENFRVSSVVRNTDYDPKLNEETMVNERLNNVSVSSRRIPGANIDGDIEKPLPTVPSPIKEVPASLLPVLDSDHSDSEQTGDVTNDKLANPIAQQSKLFDTDLFGDFLPEDLQEEYPKIYVEPSEDKHYESNVFQQIPNVSAETIFNTDPGIIQNRIDLTQSEITQNDNSTATQELPKNKKLIFPVIHEVEPPKSNIKFEKSPSFVELFHGMRIVLDDSDAKYNWRRLSTEVSLNDKYLVNNDVSYDNYDNIPNLESINEKQSYNQISNSPAMKFNNISNKSPTKSSHTQIESSPFRALAYSNMVDSTTTSNSYPSTSNIDDDFSGPKNYDSKTTGNDIYPSIIEKNITETPSKKSTPFKVVNKSPTRYVNKVSKDKLSEIERDIVEHRKVTEQPNNKPDPKAYLKLTRNLNNKQSMNDSNLGSDFSFASDINTETNKRWVQLNVPSKEDLGDETFHTPLEQPSETFSELITDKSDAISNSTLKLAEDNTNQAEFEDPQAEKLINQEEEELTSKDQTPLLDDLDFSSFDITFNSSDVTNNTQCLPNVSKLDNKGTLHGLRSSEIPKIDPPVMYRFSKDFHSIVKDDDPFWVSPSKLDFTAINKYSEKTPQKSKLMDPLNIQSNKKNIKSIPKKNLENTKEPNLTHDTSFSFLGNIVEIDNSENTDIDNSIDDYNDSKPTRLQFE